MLLESLRSFFARFRNHLDHDVVARATTTTSRLTSFFNKHSETTALIQRLNRLPETDEIYGVISELTYTLVKCDELYKTYRSAYCGILDFYGRYEAWEGYWMGADEIEAGLKMLRFWGEEEERWRECKVERVRALESVQVAMAWLFEYEALEAGEDWWKGGRLMEKEEARQRRAVGLRRVEEGRKASSRNAFVSK